jgi:hypothetical protein
MKNLAQRWTTMKRKKSSVLQRWSPLQKRPVADRCHHDGPSIARTAPDPNTTVRAPSVAIPRA